jgi:hypothetical protein
VRLGVGIDPVPNADAALRRLQFTPQST